MTIRYDNIKVPSAEAMRGLNAHIGLPAQDTIALRNRRIARHYAETDDLAATAKAFGLGVKVCRSVIASVAPNLLDDGGDAA